MSVSSNARSISFSHSMRQENYFVADGRSG